MAGMSTPSRFCLMQNSGPIVARSADYVLRLCRPCPRP